MAREIGRLGQYRYGSYGSGSIFFEEFLPELRGTRGVQAYTEMADNDATVGAILFAIEMLMRQCEFHVEPAGSGEKDREAAESNGVRWIRKGRQKTKIMCNIPLMEIPLKILEKYSTNEYCKKHGVLFPVLCNQKMNAYLKELADICGIKKH